MRIYSNGTNLFNFSKFKLWDPEMGEMEWPIHYNVLLILVFNVLCKNYEKD